MPKSPMPTPTHPTLHTQRLVLRPWRDSDLDPFAAMNADGRVMEFLKGEQTRDESAAMMARIRAHFDAHGYGLWAVEIPGEAEFIGFVGLLIPSFDAPFMPAVEVGWRLAHAYWGRGYAPEAARASLAFGFENLGLDEIVSFTIPPNANSRRVMAKIGMTHDPAGDFDHPKFPPAHRLRRHLLYRLKKADWLAQTPAATA